MVQAPLLGEDYFGSVLDIHYQGGLVLISKIEVWVFYAVFRDGSWVMSHMTQNAAQMLKNFVSFPIREKFRLS